MAADFRATLSAARTHVRQHLGVDVLINGRPCRVIWTVNEAAPSLGGFRQPILERACLLHPDDGADIERGAIVDDAGQAYTVADILPRSDHWRTLILRERA